MIDYTIDPAFNSGLLYNRGGVLDIVADEEGILVSTDGLNSGSPAMGISYISVNGNFLQNLTPATNIGPTAIDFYKNGYIYHGNRIEWFDVNWNNYGLDFEYLKPAYSGFLSRKALDALVLPDDKIVVSGRFFTDSNTTAESLRHLCVIDSTGAPLEEFPMVHCAQPIDAEIYTVDTLSDGSYIIAGRFSEVNGHPCNNVARLLPDFTVDVNFGNPLIQRSTTRTELIDSQDRIWLSLSYGGLAAAPNDSIFTTRLFPAGEVDQSFQPPVMISDFINEDPPDQYYQVDFGEVYEDSDGTFIVVGPLTSYNGMAVKNILKIYDDGQMVEGAFDGIGADEAIWENWDEGFLARGWYDITRCE